MAKTMRQLYEERAQAFEDTKKLMNEDGSFRDGATEEQYNLGMAAYNGLTAQIERRQTSERIDIAHAEEAMRNSEARGTSVDEERDTGEARKRAFLNWARMHTGYDPRSDEDRQVNMREIRNAQATTPGTAGGYVVPPLFEENLLVKTQQYFDPMSVTTNITTATGAPLPWPTIDDTNRRAKIIGENTQIGTSNMVFGTTNLTAYLYATDAILVPWTLMQDSFFDLGAFIEDRFAEAFGRTLADHFTSGSGVGMPLGMVPAAVSGGAVVVGATGETVSVSYADMLNLQDALDPSYQANARYMFHRKTLTALRNIKDNQGRPLWVPSYDANAPDMFAGEEYIVNNSMPVMAPGANSILFGNFKAYYTRTVKGVTVIRLNER